MVSVRPADASLERSITRCLSQAQEQGSGAGIVLVTGETEPIVGEVCVGADYLTWSTSTFVRVVPFSAIACLTVTSPAIIQG